jgi:hypothetical protein
MTQQMNRPGLELADEAHDIRKVLLHGEIVAFTVPLFRPAMPEANRDRAIMGAEWRHLPGPVAVVAERAMHKKQGLARSALDERHVIAIHPQGRHPLSPPSSTSRRRWIRARLAKKGKPTEG